MSRLTNVEQAILPCLPMTPVLPKSLFMFFKNDLISGGDGQGLRILGVIKTIHGSVQASIVLQVAFNPSALFSVRTVDVSSGAPSIPTGEESDTFTACRVVSMMSRRFDVHDTRAN